MDVTRTFDADANEVKVDAGIMYSCPIINLSNDGLLHESLKCLYLNRLPLVHARRVITPSMQVVMYVLDLTPVRTGSNMVMNLGTRVGLHQEQLCNRCH